MISVRFPGNGELLQLESMCCGFEVTAHQNCLIVGGKCVEPAKFLSIYGAPLWLAGPANRYESLRESFNSCIRAEKYARTATRQAGGTAAISADDGAERGGARYVLTGSWRNANISAVLPELDKLEKAASGAIKIDLSGIDNIDTTGAWVLHRLRSRLEASGSEVSFEATRRSRRSLPRFPMKRRCRRRIRKSAALPPYLRSGRTQMSYRQALTFWRSCIFWVPPCVARR